MPRRRALRRLTNASRIGRLAAAGLGLVAVTLAVVGVTAANTVAATRLDDTASTQGAQDVAPSACDGLALTVVVNGSTGGASNELVLGTSGIDVMNGGAGNDCVLGGAGNDELEGGDGMDVCIGGGGTDVLGLSCETQIQ